MNADEPVVDAGIGSQISETERLATLARLGMSDAETVATFEAIVDVLRMLLDVPSAYVVIVDADSLKIWSGRGADTLWSLPRAGSLSDEVVRTGRPLVVTDARNDHRFIAHPHVRRPDGSMPFFVGIPLTSSSGAVLGALCGFDSRLREAPDPETISNLELLATTAVAEIELKATNADLERQDAVLARRTELLETIFDNITEGIAAYDGDLNLVAVNNKGAEILGFPPGMTIADFDFDKACVAWAAMGFYGPGDPEELGRKRASGLRASRKDGGFPAIERRELVLNNGRAIKLSISPLRDGFLATYRDVSEERRRQTELAQQARYYELQHNLASMANAAPDLPSALRRFAEFNLSELKGTVAHVWLKAAQGLVSAGILVLADRPSLDAAECAALSDAIKRPSALALESAAGGEMRYVAGEYDLGDLASLCDPGLVRAGYAAPIKILDEIYVAEFHGAEGIGRRPWHATILKDLEMQLSRVAERARSERRKSEFVSTIRHELRTPLTSMRGMFELLESGLFGTQSESAAAMIGQASADSRVLGTRIEDVLAIHDLEHGDVTSAPTRCDVAALLGQLARERGLALEVDGETALDGWVDETLLIRGLDKLLAQASEAAGPDRPPRIAIVARNRWVRVSIAFEAAAEADIDALVGSVGVQLATCLFDRAGGRLASERTAAGIVFRLHLPVATGEPASPSSHGAAPWLGWASGSPETSSRRQALA